MKKRFIKRCINVLLTEVYKYLNSPDLMNEVFYLRLISNSLRSNKNNLIYFLKQLGNNGKRKFSASRAVFSCNMLRGITIFTIFIFSKIYLYL